MAITLPKTRGLKSARASREDLVPPVRPANVLADFSSAVESYSSRSTSGLDIPEIPVYNRARGRIHRFLRSVTEPTESARKHHSESFLPQLRSPSASKPASRHSMPSQIRFSAPCDASSYRSAPASAPHGVASETQMPDLASSSFEFGSIIDEYESKLSSDASLDEPCDTFDQNDEVTSIYSADSDVSGFSFGGIKSPGYYKDQSRPSTPSFKLPRIEYCLDLGADYEDSRFRVCRKVIS